MSHAGDYGAAAINLNGMIGIDVEIERAQVLAIAKNLYIQKKNEQSP